MPLLPKCFVPTCPVITLGKTKFGAGVGGANRWMEKVIESNVIGRATLLAQDREHVFTSTCQGPKSFYGLKMYNDVCGITYREACQWNCGFITSPNSPRLHIHRFGTSDDRCENASLAALGYLVLAMGGRLLHD
ncbi:hypothetical protein RRG08_031270 [Elysia crispata]|uniref:Uncharacterized protein n=1 Tax=Elysia crispata TaxID=231223 RepID=A0AAE1AIM8_9GAST|nr:hypothetical protein RRG08_031270 [Elysia crispata]